MTGDRRRLGSKLARIAAGGLLILGLSLASVPAGAELEAGASADQRGFWKDVGLGAGAAVTNVVYIPLKLVYATVGGVVGGLAWVVTFGSTETANAIWEPTLGGSYVLTPRMLTGEEPFHFNGQPPAMPPAQEYKEYEAQWQS